MGLVSWRYPVNEPMIYFCEKPFFLKVSEPKQYGWEQFDAGGLESSL